MTVRVLRLLEYIYKDAEAAVADQVRWTVQGTYMPNTRVTIRSVALPMIFEETEDG